ncbi:MAG TPA: hypothetical protein IAB35_03645 [Candidatus Faecimonas gallistercoris]|nr:hypothetical protein [Candidatus Faecimonas gallistercoris]
MSTKIEKRLYILEIIAIFIVVIILFIFKAWPEYQASLGSSEKMFSNKEYATAIEVKVANGPEFFLVINEKNNLSFIFIENQKTAVLVNQNIEGKNINKAIPEIIEKLIDNHLIENQTITLINYKDDTVFKKVVSLVQSTLNENQTTSQIIEEKSTLQIKAEQENISATQDSEILWELYFISRELMDDIKDTTTTSNEQTSSEKEITEDQAAMYADTIYQKINTYMINAKVKNQNRNNEDMPIQYIPGDNNNEIYPTTSSWYYIKNYKVYAEIGIPSKNREYIFCYNGSQEEKRKGSCS